MVITNKIDFRFKGKNCSFIRIKAEDLSLTIEEILSELANLSWLSKVSNEATREAFKLRAEKTVEKIEHDLKDSNNETKIKMIAGEYIVSVLSKKAIVKKLVHTDIPLMELLGRKISNNPGFDFYTENEINGNIIFCGEAKYLNQKNAHNESLKQSNNFITNSYHIMDLPLLENFTTEQSQKKLNAGIFGSSMGFSINKSTSDEKIIETIINNIHFQQLIEKCVSAILVGVEVV